MKILIFLIIATFEINAQNVDSAYVTFEIEKYNVFDLFGELKITGVFQNNTNYYIKKTKSIINYINNSGEEERKEAFIDIFPMLIKPNSEVPFRLSLKNTLAESVISIQASGMQIEGFDTPDLQGKLNADTLAGYLFINGMIRNNNNDTVKCYFPAAIMDSSKNVIDVIYLKNENGIIPPGKSSIVKFKLPMPENYYKTVIYRECYTLKQYREHFSN